MGKEGHGKGEEKLTKGRFVVTAETTEKDPLGQELSLAGGLLVNTSVTGQEYISASRVVLSVAADGSPLHSGTPNTRTIPSDKSLLCFFV